MLRPDDVDARVGLEQPELRAEARIEVEQLVAAVAPIEAQV